MAIIDIPNAFVQAEWQGDTVLMKLRGCMVELMVCTSPSLYIQYVTMENGKMVLYLEVLKVIYGCLQSA